MIFHWPYRTGELVRVRALLMKRATGLCERCGDAGSTPMGGKLPPLIAHHERYAPELTLADFRLLCRSCHRIRHHEPDAPKVPARLVSRKKRVRLWRGLAADDFTILQTVAQLEGTSITLRDAARACGVTPSQLRYLLMALGLKPTTTFSVRAIIGGEPLSDLLAAGEIVVEETAAEPAGAVA